MPTHTLIEIRPARHGRGLFATAPVTTGGLLLPLLGPAYSGAELDARGYRAGYPLQVDLDRYLLLDEPGVYCNHSCDPNAGIDDALRLFALRPITAGEEVCFDYSTTMLENNGWTMHCGCGARACRGLIEDFDRLPEALQRLRLQQGAVLPFIRRRLALACC